MVEPIIFKYVNDKFTYDVADLIMSYIESPNRIWFKDRVKHFIKSDINSILGIEDDDCYYCKANILKIKIYRLNVLSRNLRDQLEDIQDTQTRDEYNQMISRIDMFVLDIY